MHVLGGMQRDTHVNHLSDLSAPHARTVDHVFGFDIALVGRHTAYHPFFRFDVGYHHIFKNFGAAHFGPFSQRPSGLDWIGHTIFRKIKCGQQIIGTHPGDQIARFF